MKTALFFLLTLFVCFPAEAAIPDGVDSTLYVYYRRCNDNVRKASVLETADTLFRLSEERGDVRMQTAALSLKADYYYYNNKLDSLKAWVSRVQRFARQNDQPKYYYFTWNRLVLYYIKHTQYTLAQYELQQLLVKADEDDYKPATAQAYQQMGHIYILRGQIGLSLEYYRKALAYIEQHVPDYHSTTNLCIQLADAYVGLKDYDNGAKMLAKARKYIKQPSEEWDIKLHEANRLSYQKKGEEARRLLTDIELHSPSISQDRKLEAWYIYYKSNGYNHQALAALNQLIAEYQRLGHEESFYLDRFRGRANLYAELGDNRAAYENLLRYVDLRSQQTETDSKQTLEEFATMLDVTRLDREKTEAEQKVQLEHLRRNQLIITALGLILTLASAFIFIQVRTNRRLNRAKRAAEESDRMKGLFIRHISHEINTPLNAIVGFSDLASTLPADDPDRSSYIDTIRESSGQLQKLIDDVLYIADIESAADSPACAEIDINHCCRQCIDKISSSRPDTPQIVFEPGREPCQINTSRIFVGKVLNELISNAVRFAPGSIVTLAYTLSEGNIVFTVTDAGKGIPAEDAERIFERFVKLDTFSQGLGLGLGVCRLIAVTLKGSIYLDTTYTQGARFVFILPAA